MTRNTMLSILLAALAVTLVPACSKSPYAPHGKGGSGGTAGGGHSGGGHLGGESAYGGGGHSAGGAGGYAGDGCGGDQNRALSFDYYVDGAVGNDANSGKGGAPWKSLAKALSSAPGGTTVGVHPGNYTLSETTPAARSDYLTLRAVSDVRPLIDGVHLSYDEKADAFLRIEGFEIYSENKMNLVYLRNAGRIQVVDSEIHAKKWAKGGKGVDAIKILHCADIVLDHNLVHEINRGATISFSERVTLRRNYIRPKAGSAVQYAGGNVDGVIEYNHIQGEPYIGYPDDADAVDNPHASIISVRSSNLTIRGNHMHGMGNSSGIMFYQPDAAGGEAAYSNILLENNALYDTINTYALRMYNLGSNVIVRNNLIYSRLSTGDCNGQLKDARYRYSSALTVHNAAPGHDGSGLELYNNIFIGIVSVPDAVQERNNIVWSWGPNPWLASSPSGSSLIITDSYEGCGNHSSFFESGFFEQAPDYAFPSIDPANWSLAKQSIGVNFGDATAKTTESLAALCPDGFLSNKRPPRSATAHSVGPLETEH